MMPIYLGDEELVADTIFVGNTAISEVYVGDTLVWPPTAPGLGTVRVTEWSDNRVTEWSDQRVTENHT